MWDAEKAVPPLSLADGLKAAAKARLQQTREGTNLIATAGNGHSVTFSLPAAGQGATPHQIAILCEELLTLSTDSTDALVASGVPIPKDEQVLAEMLHRLQPVRSLSNSSFLGLRFA